MEEGFDPETFWLQTCRSYTIALRARVERKKRDAREATVMAYLQAGMNGSAFAGKLGPLDRWLSADEDKSRGGAALLGALLAMKKKGVPMTVRKIDREAA